MISSSENPSFVVAYLTTTSMALASCDGKGRPYGNEEHSKECPMGM
jgi:hypothetical protein